MGKLKSFEKEPGIDQPVVVSWGDQGDGTYCNPILDADYPDVDVKQLGETYFMISSKQHMSPGMIVLQSKDMVNWTIIGHVWEKLNWSKRYDWDQMDGYGFGVWAGDLSYHDGQWFCYQIDPKVGLLMSTATHISGSWSEPHLVGDIQKIRVGGIATDPAVYWDEAEHQGYLIFNAGTKEMGKQGQKRVFETHLYKLSPDGKTLIGDPHVIYRGLGAEAAKIYKIRARWYVFLSQWFDPDPHILEQTGSDKRDRKQIVLRSKTDSIYGPYEWKVVLQRGNGIIRSCSQGALMQAPNKSWWYTHQLIQNEPAPFQGRPQMLEPVEWIDGWPVIGQDIDGDGIGEPVRKYGKPIHGYPIVKPQTDDEFDDSVLQPQWEWNHNPRDSHWSLTERPGWLRLKASVPIRAGGFWNACNTVSQRIMGKGSGKATAKFDLRGMEPGQRTGFVRFGGVYHLLGVVMDGSGNKHLFFGDAKGDYVTGPRIKSSELLISTINRRDRAQFLYSLDGSAFEAFGPPFTIAFGRWTGDRLGLFCWNDLREVGYTDIDWFHYRYTDQRR